MEPAQKKKENKAKKYIKVVIHVLALVLLIETFGTKGFLGYIVIMIVMTGMQLKRNWEPIKNHFILTLHWVETMFFGKPLNKELWDKGEFKKKKFKFVWKSKKRDANKYMYTENIKGMFGGKKHGKKKT